MTQYPFLDIAVLDDVRSRLAAGDALVLLETGLRRVIWANGGGAALFGYSAIEDITGAESGLGMAARRQIAATSGFPTIGRDRSLLIRLPDSAVLTFLASSLTLPSGQAAILIAACPEDATPLALRAVAGFAEPRHAAMLDADGAVLASSSGFTQLELPDHAALDLIVRADGEARVVRGRLQVNGAAMPAGLLRLAEEPAQFLLLVSDEYDEPEEPTLAEPEAVEAPDLAPAVAESEIAVDADDEPELPLGLPTSPETLAIAADETPEAESAEAETAQPEPIVEAPEPQQPAAPPRPSTPVRFIWRTDAEGRFVTISPEFAAAVGAGTSDVIGKRFADVAEAFGLDPTGEIAGLMERRDTWSGRSVLWPIEGEALRVPVDLAALPAYDRARNFEGFRGFGVARMADPVEDTGRRDDLAGPSEPETTPDQLAHTPPEAEQGPSSGRAENVVHLAARRPSDSAVLTPSERSTFREIGDRLKQVAEPAAADSAAPVEAEAPVADAPVEADHFEETAPLGDAATAEAAMTETVPENHPADEEPAEPAKPPAPVASGFLPSALAVVERSRGKPAVDTSILAKLPVPLLIHSGDTLHYANREFLDLTGYESIGDLARNGGLDRLFAQPAPAAEGDERRMRLVKRDGSEIPVEARLQSVPWNGSGALMLAIRPQPVTYRPADAAATVATAEEALSLKSRVEEMSAILDTATDGVVLIAHDSTIRSISKPAEALFGFDSSEAAGKPFVSLFAAESQRAARDYLNGLAEHGVASVLNDGREVIGLEAAGRFIPLFMTIGRLPNETGYCAVLRDITQWKRAEEELTQARSEAERASSQKTEFLARVSHEIRTPLNAIIGFSELMIDEKFGAIGNGRYRDYLRDINRSGNHVLDLVNDLLDISKIEAGEQEMSYEAVSLNDTLAESVAMMQPQANRERVIIRSSFAGRVPEVVADLRSVRQIALNLLSNAVRFTQAGGQVIVSTSYEPNGEVAMRVRDTGVGMTQAEIDQALKPFRQINALKRPRGDGTGLGLPLTKAMVEANRARFVIQSTPGEGTLVEISFPSTRVLAD